MIYKNLDLLNEREMDYIPIHFSRISLSGLDPFLNKDNILNWVREKLDGRFALIKHPNLNSDEKLKSSDLILGFEEEKELTYFMLACPYFRR